jgi:superfamily II DNA helicase RecQ
MKCDTYSQRYDCGSYYSDTMNKDEVLRNWSSGLLFATGALGAGVDLMRIKAVVHVECPYGMINFEQEVGRGGREGGRMKSIVILRKEEYIDLMEMEEGSLLID